MAKRWTLRTARRGLSQALGGAMCSIAVLLIAAVSARAATLHQLRDSEFLLVGPIDERDLAATDAIPDGSTILVFGWGHSREAWYAITRMSDRFSRHGVKVQIHYGEDAAGAITGAETTILGRVRFDDPVPSRESDWLQKVASTIDRMRHICQTRVPDHAPSQDAMGLVGWRGDMPARKGKRAESNQRWYYQRVGPNEKGKWVMDDETKVRREEESFRKEAQNKANARKAQADRRKADEAKRRDQGTKDVKDSKTEDGSDENPDSKTEIHPVTRRLASP